MGSPFDALGAAVLGVFGEAVTLTNQDGVSRTTRGVFRDMPEVVEVTRGRMANVRDLTLSLRKSDAADLVIGATVTVASRPGEVFKVVGAAPDGTPGDTLTIARLEVR